MRSANHQHLFRLLTSHFWGCVITEGFGVEIVAGHCVRTGAATAADINELALAALALVAFEIPQLLEEFGVFPDIPE